MPARDLRRQTALTAILAAPPVLAEAPALEPAPRSSTVLFEDSPSSSPEPGSLVLRWNAPPSCPPQSALEHRIAALVEAADAGTGVEAEVELLASDTGYAGTLRLQAPWGESTRPLQAERCETIAEATALLVAITIDPLTTDGVLRTERAQAERSEDPETQPTPEDAPAEAVVPPVAETAPPTATTSPNEDASRSSAPQDRRSPPPPTPRERTTQGLLRVEVSGGLGLLPQLGAALAGTVGLRHRWLRVGVHGRYWLPQQVAHPLDPAVTAELRLWSLGVHACAGPRWGAIELPVCGGMDAGAMRGEGRGALPQTRDEQRPWVALRVGPALVWSPNPRIGLWLGLDLAASALRPRFHITDLGPIHEVGVLSGRALGGLEIRVP